MLCYEGTRPSMLFPVYMVAWLVGGSDSTLSTGRGIRQQEKTQYSNVSYGEPQP